MKNYGIIMKMLIRNMFKKSGDKKNVKIFIGISLAVAYVFLMFTLMTGAVSLAPALKETGLTGEMLTLIFGMAVLVMLFFGIPLILSTLYFSKDSEFFLSLPVGSGTVFFAKISIVYLSMLIVEVALLLPTVVVLGALTGMGFQFYPIIILGILLLPAFPLMLSSIIAMPLMFIVSAFRNRGALSSVVMILMFVLFFGAYYGVVYALGFSSDETGTAVSIAEILLSNADALRLAANILLPLSSIARLATLTPTFGLSVPMSALVNTGAYLGTTAALLAIALGASSAFYKRGIMAMLESSTVKDKKQHEFKSGGGVIKALMLKEWRQLIRTPQFALNCFMGVIMPVIVIIFMSILNMRNFSGAEQEDVEIVKMIVCGVNLMMLLLISVGLNMGAMTCITREGESFAFSKSLPVSANTQIAAKRRLYLIMSYSSIALGILITLIFAFDWMIIGGLLLMIPYNYIFVTLAIYLDLNSPNLKWTTPQEAMKRNMKGLVPFLINMVVSIIVFIAILVTRIMISAAEAEFRLMFTLIHVGVWVVLIGLAVIVAVVMHKMLAVRAERLYDSIEI